MVKTTDYLLTTNYYNRPPGTLNSIFPTSELEEELYMFCIDCAKINDTISFNKIKIHHTMVTSSSILATTNIQLLIKHTQKPKRCPNSHHCCPCCHKNWMTNSTILSVKEVQHQAAGTIFHGKFNIHLNQVLTQQKAFIYLTNRHYY